VERGSVKIQHFFIWTMEKEHLYQEAKALLIFKGLPHKTGSRKEPGLVWGQVRSAPGFALRRKE
jgi:hypothetical protein